MIVSQCKTTFKNEPIFWSNSNKAFPKKISFWSNKAFPKKIKWKILWSSSLFSSTNQTWKKNNNDIHKNRYVSHTSNICIISLKPYNIHFMMITDRYHQIRTLICFFLCMQGLNLISLIRWHKTLSVKLTRTHHNIWVLQCKISKFISEKIHILDIWNTSSKRTFFN